MLRPDGRAWDGTYVIALITAQDHAITRKVPFSGAACVTQQACNTSNQNRAVFFLFKTKSFAQSCKQTIFTHLHISETLR